MTTTEFERWRKLHTALFPGIISFLRRNFGQDNDQIELFWKEWYRKLAKLTLEEASEASRKLSDELDDPSNYERHPFLIKKLASEARIERREREWPALLGQEECENCHNTGLVNIVYVTNKGRIYTAATRCTCRAGEKWKNDLKTAFDPTQHTKELDYFFNPDVKARIDAVAKAAKNAG